jgi:NADPH2:quinone reductase
VAGQVVLVQGGGGGVGSFAVGLARRAGARVITTVRSQADVDAAMRSGAEAVVVTAGRPMADIAAEIRRLAPQGIQHIVEVAFDDNIDLDMQVLAVGGSIASYATTDPRPQMPFWELLFKNARMFLIGSDDFPAEARREAASALNDLVASGWQGARVGRSFPLSEIAQAHEAAENKRGPGRIVIALPQ